jgi:hypothetical protein
VPQLDGTFGLLEGAGGRPACWPGRAAPGAAACGPDEGAEDNDPNVEYENEPGVTHELGHGTRLGIGAIHRIWHHPPVTFTAIFAQQSGYWLAGALTVIAAALVTMVILASSRPDDPQ